MSVTSKDEDEEGGETDTHPSSFISRCSCRYPSSSLYCPPSSPQPSCFFYIDSAVLGEREFLYTLNHIERPAPSNSNNISQKESQSNIHPSIHRWMYIYYSVDNRRLDLFVYVHTKKRTCEILVENDIQSSSYSSIYSCPKALS